MGYFGSKKKKKIVFFKSFHSFLGINDSDLETISVVVNNEHYDNYVNNDFSKIISVHIILEKNKSVNNELSTTYVLDDKDYYSIAKFDVDFSGSNKSPRNDCVILDKNEVFSNVAKAVRIMDFLLTYQNLWGVSFDNIKNYNLNFLSEVSHITEKEYLTVDIAPKAICEYTYRYHAISKIYDKYTQVLQFKNNDNLENMKNDYAHIFISFYCLNIINGFSLNFINDKNCYAPIDPKDSFLMIIDKFSNDFSHRIIEHNVFTSWLFHYSITDQKLYNEINKYMGKFENSEIIYYVNKNGLRPENVNQYLKNVYFFVKTYNDYVANTSVENDYWHSDLSDYAKRINAKTTEDRIYYLLFEKWMELNINNSSSFLIKELKTQKDNITKDIIDFLFNKDILNYFNSYQKHKYNEINPYLIDDFKEEGIKTFSNEILLIKNRVSLENVFYLPFIIKKANDYFDLGIENHIINDFYNHYVNYICTEANRSAIWNVGVEIEEKINIIFVHIVTSLNNDNMEKFITIFPELSDLLIERTLSTSDNWYDNNPSYNLPQVSSIISTIMNVSSDFYDSLINKEITLKHYINIMSDYP